MNVRPLILLCLVPALLLLKDGAALAQGSQALEQTPQAATLPSQKAEAPAGKDPSSAPAMPLPAGIEKALEKALDKKLAPVMRILAEMQEQKVRLTDVLGGLGYIFGLVGVAAYFKRKP